MRPTIETKIAAVREALKGSDTDAIKVAYDDLQTHFQGISEDLYKQAAASAGAPGPEAGAQASAGPEASSAKKAEGDVVDAEFEVVDDDKKK